ncbi:MAG: hypothetical protein CMA72_00180 [Euryarchaeota archaeon]|jgi:translation initiation factor 5B|nr:hypothetical protein [Euryarchaeota archaeon]|tara:strand:+ start:184 stop:2271 length:2088 start_codon:yes stop_codon:yes gene_type:complete
MTSEDTEHDLDGEVKPKLRQPIVAVTGHVDHGKTSLLDYLRRLGDNFGETNVMDREAGGITQEIGVTQIPLNILTDSIKTMPFKSDAFKFESPGLIFIDTPGHESFGSIRKRGGGVADLAILVVDIKDGLMPQTIEAIRILEDFRYHKNGDVDLGAKPRGGEVPYIVVGNKIDKIHQWDSESSRSSFKGWTEQSSDVSQHAERHFNKLIGQFATEAGKNLVKYWDGIQKGFNPDTDRLFVPMSALKGEGIQDLLFTILFMAEHLSEEKRDRITIQPDEIAEGYVLESREEVGLGKTIDIILTKGEIKVGDDVAYNTNEGPVGNITDENIRPIIRAVRAPRGLSEMRDAGDRWDNVSGVAKSAAGLKLVIPNMEDVLIGSRIFFPKPNDDYSHIRTQMMEEHRRIVDSHPVMCSVCNGVFTSRIFSKIHTDPSADGFSKECKYAEPLRIGAVVKARTVGGLEALLYELAKRKIPISSAEVGSVNKADLRRIHATEKPEHRFLIGLSVEGNDQVQQQLDDILEGREDADFHYLQSNIIHQITEQMDGILEDMQAKLAGSALIFKPGQIRHILYNGKSHFKDKPAAFPVHVVKGQIRVGQELLRNDGSGKTLGKILSIGNEGQLTAHEGEKVSIGMGIRYTRSNISEGDEFWADIPENQAKLMKNIPLSDSEKSAFDEIVKIHREILGERGFAWGWRL